MDGTPKLKRRSLTLGRPHKSADSPKTPPRRTTNIESAYTARFTPTRAMKSPSVTSLSSDGGIECTPPQKKLSLDDSIDYSPKCFDSSFSPSCLLSQTLASDSPEVGWKWGRRNTDELVPETAATTPDSAYAADSSFISAGSTSTEVTKGIGRLRGDSQSQRIAYELQREEQRKKREVQLRRAAKLRTDELLKQRYARLQEQLRDADERRQKEKEKENHPFSAHQISELCPTKNEVAKVEIASETCAVAITESVSTFANDTLDDFLNDSDSDCLLIEATQQVESKIIEMTQVPNTEELTHMPDDEEWQLIQIPVDEEFKLTQMPNDEFQLTQMPDDEEFKPTQMPEVEPSNSAVSTNSAATNDTTSRQDKRSSLYMKFLDDDSPDDWFLSLDDVILQATQQTKKARSNFQRYNSMPTDTLTTLATSSANAAKTTSTITTSSLRTSAGGSKLTEAAKCVNSPKMKRHASSHTISPSNTSLSSAHRDRQLHLRK